MASKEKKVRHHHVLRTFLDAWAFSGKIYCLSNGNIFNTNTKNVAVESDFYRLEELTPGDRRLILKMIEPFSDRSKKTALNFLHMFTMPFTARALLDKNQQLTPELERELNVAVQNLEEDYHEKIETKGLHILSRLRDGDCSILRDDKRHIVFSYFLAEQLFRTRAMRERMRANVRSGADYDFNRCWKILAHIYAGNVGGTIFLERKKQPVTILRNETAIPFITGDQPVFNLHGGALGLGNKFFSLYYPVSPSVAIFIDDAARPLEIDKSKLNKATVTWLNDEMANHAYSQIFASSNEGLLKYQSRQMNA